MAIYYLWKIEKKKNKNGSMVITGEILNIWGHYGNTFNKWVFLEMSGVGDLDDGLKLSNNFRNVLNQGYSNKNNLFF